MFYFTNLQYYEFYVLKNVLFEDSLEIDINEVTCLNRKYL